MYFVNSILATILLLSYCLPYISPKTVPAFTVVSLTVPFLFLINSFFVVYWLIKLKKHFILSATVLGIGLLVSSPFYKLSNVNSSFNDDVKIMSYNVRMFNVYQWTKDKTIASKISELVSQKDPDILVIQEYHKATKQQFAYKYKYFQPKPKNTGLAIFSKYPIINKGSLNFKKTNNNVIYADVLKGKDTVRVYNVHLQSLKINPSKENFGEESSEKLFARLKDGFLKQASQAEKLIEHEQKWKGKKIICGDFNNTAYSWVYKQIAANKKDAFIEAGSGTGKSFNYFFPMRIDFILTDTKCDIHQFKTFSKKYSDHFPIMARLHWN